MKRAILVSLIAASAIVVGNAQRQAPDWVAVSNGYTQKLLAVEIKHHDFILAQGPLPPDLLRKAVMEQFVPQQ